MFKVYLIDNCQYSTKYVIKFDYGIEFTPEGDINKNKTYFLPWNQIKLIVKLTN